MASIRSFILSEFQELQQRCTLTSKSSPDSPFIQKCLMKCQGVTSNFPKVISGGQISYFLQQYAEAILDFTFHEENQLTDEEFPESNTKERISSIFDDLDKVQEMCDRISAGRRPEELLGNEIAECLLWRRGALMYMYCSTIQQDEGRMNRWHKDYRKNLKRGIHFLQGMFRIRDLVLNTAQVPGERDTLGLFKMGIYSDTHLLAMMYSGEMCYWFIKSTTEITQDEIAAKKLGIEVLETYIKAIEQFAELQGWSNDRAKQLLTELRTLHT